MSDRHAAMHERIETIFNKSVDHIHADLLHSYIDEQKERMQTVRFTSTANAKTIKSQIATIDRLQKELVEVRAWNKVAVQQRDLAKLEADAANARERPAFMAGFAAGEDETFDGGKIICKDFYTEVTERLWQQYRCKDDTDWVDSVQEAWDNEGGQ